MKIPEFSNDDAGQRAAEALRERGRSAAAGALSASDRAARASTGEPESSIDAVEISPLSRAFLAEPEGTSRVEALQKQYEAGTYAVNPEQLAKSLIDSHLVIPDRPAGESPKQPANPKS